jgi:hypothetical protein
MDYGVDPAKEFAFLSFADDFGLQKYLISSDD